MVGMFSPVGYLIMEMVATPRIYAGCVISNTCLSPPCPAVPANGYRAPEEGATEVLQP